MIRSAAKALILQDGKLLLNRCVGPDGKDYYGLPGGGQHLYETMEEAIQRECLEETGLTVKVLRFAALAEEIYDDPAVRLQSPDYSHRMLHIFLAAPTDSSGAPPSELDFEQQESRWVPVEEAVRLDLRPANLAEKLIEILSTEAPVYLGSMRIH